MQLSNYAPSASYKVFLQHPYQNSNQNNKHNNHKNKQDTDKVPHNYQLIEKTTEYNKPLSSALVDHETCNSVKLEAVFKLLL